MPWLLIFGVIALFIVFAAVGAAQRRKRREALAAWVGRYGLSFSPDRDAGFDEQFPEFDCLRSGSDRYAYNIARGTWDGRSLLAFDYHYTTQSTDSKGRRKTNHHHFSAVILGAKVPLKPLIVRSENIFDKLKGAFGFDDIDFESAQFSRRFYVAAPDRRWAYDVLHPRAIQFLLDSPRFSIEFDRRHVIAWRSKQFTVADREQAIALIDGLLDQLPDYVRKSQEQLT